MIPTTRGLGLACAVGILIGAGFVLTVLPGLLVLSGRWVFWPQVPRTSQGPVDRSGSVWTKVGNTVARSPGRFAGGLVLALLVASVVLTYGAALGLAWVVYTEVFDFAAMDSGVPLLAFLFLVALGMDYNIFLVARAAEEAPEHGTRRGMLRALASTGGVITSAGVLLAAVFASLGVLPLVVLAQLGIVIFIGVLLDTLLVRTVLVPALAQWLGERFWWPRRIARTGPTGPGGLTGPRSTDPDALATR